MKTLTEFSGFLLKEAMAKKAALQAEGKSEEEIQTALTELMKLDEAKTGFYKNVIDMTSSRMDRVKRVVVALRATETEKVPEAYIEREGHFYLVEYFPSNDSRGPSRDSRDSRGGYGNDRGRGGRGGSGQDRGRGGNDRGRGNDRGGESRGFDRDRAPRAPGAPSLLPNGEPRGTFAKLIPGAVPAQKPRPPRENRAPRPSKTPKSEGANAGPRAPRAPRGPKGAGELRLVLKGESQTTLHGSGETATPAKQEGEVHILPIVPSTETPPASPHSD